MTDPTEAIRRELVAELNETETTKAELEKPSIRKRRMRLSSWRSGLDTA